MGYLHNDFTKMLVVSFRAFGSYGSTPPPTRDSLLVFSIDQSMYLAHHPQSVVGSLKFSDITLTRVAMVVNALSLRYYALIFIIPNIVWSTRFTSLWFLNSFCCGLIHN